MHADYVNLEVWIEGELDYVKMLGVVHGNLVIHKTPSIDNTVQDNFSPDIDYNDPGWRISDILTGRMICNNDWTPFYEAVNTVLALQPIFDTMPDPRHNDLLFDWWLVDNYRAILSIVQMYTDW